MCAEDDVLIYAHTFMVISSSTIVKTDHATGKLIYSAVVELRGTKGDGVRDGNSIYCCVTRDRKGGGGGSEGGEE